MTPHLDDGRIAEVLDGEVPSGELAGIREHLAGCPSCAARLAAAQAGLIEVDELIGVLDLPVPESPAAVISLHPTRRRQWLRHTAWAASLVVAAGAGYLSRGPFRPDPARSATRVATIDSGAPASPAAPTAVAAADPGAATETLRDAAALSGRGTVVPGRTEEPEERALDETVSRDQAVTGQSTPVRDAADPLGAARQENALERPAPSPQATPPTRQVPAEGRLVPRDQRARSAGLESLAGARRADEVATTTMEAAKVVADTISLADAVVLLGGSIRLVDGRLPRRVETVSGEVHVVYGDQAGEFRLAQRRVDDRLVWRLVVPTGFPAESLAAIRARVVE